MNRRQRRIAGKQETGGGPGVDPATLFVRAVACHQQGQLAQAEALYRQVLALDRDHPQTLHNLGLVSRLRGHLEAAVDLLGRAVSLEPESPGFHSGLGNALKEQGRLTEAVDSHRRSLALDPAFPQGLGNLGNALLSVGQPQAAIACYRRALQVHPGLAELHVNLGNLLKDQGRLDEAIGCYRQALALRADFAEAHNNLGSIHFSQNRFAESEACYRQALALKPGFTEAGFNLARVLLTQGNAGEALTLAVELLGSVRPREARALFVRCLAAFPEPLDPAIRPHLRQALAEGWGRPGDLAAAAIGLIKRSAAFLRPGDDPAGLAGDDLLIALLQACPVCDVELEARLAAIRRRLLDRAAASGPASPRLLALACALATQCFINEYAFAVAAEEQARLESLGKSLTERLQSASPIAPHALAVFASYAPLDSLEGGERLTRQRWDAPLAGIIEQQLAEPAEERRIAGTIPQLTPIRHEVSVLVRQQYEQNPYPRWTRPVLPYRPGSVEAYLRQLFPLARIEEAGEAREILIAGCGTGLHSVETAQQFPSLQVLAIDLSLASLCYARRKTAALGVANLEYGQADIMELASLGRSFDVIEAAGVLHHLADPMAGWTVLLSLLRPGGFMRVGLYSELARQHIVAARAFIAERGYPPTPEGIRRCRQDILALDPDSAVGRVTRSPDFHTISACRDLLFHVQEHRLTIPQIAAFLAANDLAFIGFDVGPATVRRYAGRFPEDRAMSDLDRWTVFESENPTIFAGMYNFWIQKKPPLH